MHITNTHKNGIKYAEEEQINSTEITQSRGFGSEVTQETKLYKNIIIANWCLYDVTKFFL